MIEIFFLFRPPYEKIEESKNVELLILMNFQNKIGKPRFT